jgi:hypothetical protein
MQTFDTIIGVSAGVNTSGQIIDFDGNSVIGLTVTNNSGESIAFSVDAGSNWTTVTNGNSGTPALRNPSDFRLRKTASDAYPVSVRVQWSATNTPAPFVMSDVVPNNADGRPNGTIYIRVGA